MAAGVLGALGLRGEREVTLDGDQPLKVWLAGQKLSLESDLRPQVERAATQWLRAPITLEHPHLETTPLTRSRQALGAGVDVERTLESVRALIRHATPTAPTYLTSRGASASLALATKFDAARATDILFAWKDQIDRPPRDARFDPANKKVLPGHKGLRLDIWATLTRLERSLEQGRRRIAVIANARSPHRRAHHLAEVSATTVLGTFRTRYDASMEARDRTFNLKVAAEKIHGRVLLPGEAFDFNHMVGERNEANGFRVAPVIAQGELVDGIGGGTCQISGTLHAAAFFSGLSILERQPHSRPSSYIKLGLDAAVAYPTLNLRFENDRPFPIVLGVEVDKGWVTATLWGTEQPHEVTFVRRIQATPPFEEREREDPALPQGVRVLAQRGVPGFEIKSTRLLRNTKTDRVTRTTIEDTYPPTTQIWRVGTGESAPDDYEPPPGDDHPEYRADVYLSLTQGAGIDGIVERKRAGRTGTPGWTGAPSIAVSDPGRP